MKKIEDTNILYFDWDEGNRYKNIDKHEVSNKESEEVFFNKPIFFFEDKNHSQKEKRFLALGKTDKGRLLSIFFTMRGKKIRVISARDMSKKERRTYEQS